MDSELRIVEIPPEHQASSTIKGHTDSVDFVRINENASSPQIISASHDGTVKIWDLSRKNELSSILAHQEGVFCCDVSPNGRQIASCSPDQTVALWDISNRNNIARATNHTHKVYFVLFISDSQLLSCGRDRNIFLWDLRNMRAPSKNFATPQSGTFRSVALSPDNSILLATTAESGIEAYEFPSGRPIANQTINYDMRVFPQEKEFLVPPAIIYNARFFRNQRNTFLSSHQDHAVRKFELNNGNLTQISYHRNHWDYVRHVEISSNERFYVSTAQDGSVRVWDAASNTPQLSLIGHTQIVSSAAIARDNRTIVTSSYDQTLKIFTI
ncbi:unnamed protein product [Blepharisma stoltei]|uniref:WD40 repeat-like protein n=1 Tax=Blepharisma stoltei TaxID=1481888 RepID=A0AAU9IC58_9CILI|nr:unnamed protein product [Blepharisma stoltei]